MTPIQNALLIDDSPIDSFLNEKVLAKFIKEIKTKTINLPLEALAYLESINDPSSKNQPLFIPDIVFIDLHMPQMNGLQLLDALEQIPAFNENQIGIYILTSSCSYNDIQSALKKRLCHGYINKPLNKSKIHKLIDHIKTSQKENGKLVFWR